MNQTIQLIITTANELDKCGQIRCADVLDRELVRLAQGQVGQLGQINPANMTAKFQQLAKDVQTLQNTYNQASPDLKKLLMPLQARYQQIYQNMQMMMNKMFTNPGASYNYQSTTTQYV
jgi:hypothetical protein